jgi:hypothetical protein
MAENPLTFPTVHLNGSGFERLFKLHADVNGSLRTAIAKLEEAAPHARDFYVQGDDSFQKARKEHEDRVARIRSVMSEIDEVLENLSDQKDGR